MVENQKEENYRKRNQNEKIIEKELIQYIFLTKSRLRKKKQFLFCVIFNRIFKSSVLICQK
jgi:hypothetical protein